MRLIFCLTLLLTLPTFAAQSVESEYLRSSFDSKIWLASDGGTRQSTFTLGQTGQTPLTAPNFWALFDYEKRMQELRVSAERAGITSRAGLFFYALTAISYAPDEIRWADAALWTRPLPWGFSGFTGTLPNERLPRNMDDFNRNFIGRNW